MLDAAIQTQNLTKYYGEFAALTDLSLEVQPGEVYGFLGPNGAGKTTLIRTILDEIRPSLGRCWILGKDCRQESLKIRSEIGYLPADLALYPRLTGHELLEFFANLRGYVDWGHVLELSERLGADLAKRVGDLSTGNRQKIGLIQAFMSRPRLLIMDEPSAGLDPLVQRELQSMMRETAMQGNTVFLSSHTLSEVQRVADRVGIIRNGQMVAVEPLDALRARALRRIEIDFSDPIDPNVVRALPGVRDLVATRFRAVFGFAGDMGELLRSLSTTYNIAELETREADLDEVFLSFYRDPPPSDQDTREPATNEAVVGSPR